MDTDKFYQMILRQGRPLDAAIVLYQNKQVSVDALFSILATYQNQDGGFAYGIEPDCSNPNSSPISSWSATEILFETNLHRKHLPLTSRLETYLSNIFDETGGEFWLTQPSNNDYPCAPWWKHQDPPWRSEFNPSAALTGFLFVNTEEQKYSEHINQLIERYLGHEHMEMHDLVCVTRLYEYLHEENDLRSKSEDFVDKLQKDIEAACFGFDQDTAYRATPSQFFKRFNHPLASRCSDLINRQADVFRLKLMSNSWVDILWSWGQESEAFSKAKWAWQSQLTLAAIHWISKLEGNTYD